MDFFSQMFADDSQCFADGHPAILSNRFNTNQNEMMVAVRNLMSGN